MPTYSKLSTGVPSKRDLLGEIDTNQHLGHQRKRVVMDWLPLVSRSPSSALSNPFFGWEGSPSKLDYIQKGTLILTSLPVPCYPFLERAPLLKSSLLEDLDFAPGSLEHSSVQRGSLSLSHARTA